MASCRNGGDRLSHAYTYLSVDATVYVYAPTLAVYPSPFLPSSLSIYPSLCVGMCLHIASWQVAVVVRKAENGHTGAAALRYPLSLNIKSNRLS